MTWDITGGEEWFYSCNRKMDLGRSDEGADHIFVTDSYIDMFISSLYGLLDKNV